MKKITVIVLFFALLIALSQKNARTDCSKGKELYEQAVSQNKDIALRMKLLEASLEECKDFNAYIELAKAYEAQSQFKEAEKALLDAKNVADGDKAMANVFFRLGTVYEKMNRENEAFFCFRKSYSYHPYPKAGEKIKALELRRMNQGMSSAEIKETLKSFSYTRATFQVEPSLDLYINFEFDKASLDSEGVSQSDELGTALSDLIFKNNSFLIIGHTDKKGEKPYNQNLSEKRAEAVKDYLIRKFSISRDRLQTEGHGEENLLYQGDSEEEHALNRRVEVQLKK
jgi:outer membrane protein OmpA-like peptidoglycan-associated protein